MRLKDWVYPEATEIDTERDLEIIKSFLPKKGTILDAGGGIGRIAISLAKLGCKVVLLDISKTALNFAKECAEKEKVKIDFLEGDVCNLKFRDNSFDLVLALRDVVNYSLDVKKAAKELVRVLKNGGYLIASITNKTFWLTKVDRWNYKLERIKNILSTERMLTEKELKELFKGIKVEKIVGSGYCSGNIPSEVIKDKNGFVRLENFVGNHPELKFACEYLVLIGRKHA